jgi:hypothetical protein
MVKDISDPHLVVLIQQLELVPKLVALVSVPKLVALVSVRVVVLVQEWVQEWVRVVVVDGYGYDYCYDMVYYPTNSSPIPSHHPNSRDHTNMHYHHSNKCRYQYTLVDNLIVQDWD